MRGVLSEVWGGLRPTYWTALVCVCGLQELKELAALAYRDTTAENREYWKNEMGQALREIQQVYEEKLETMRTEIEASYSLKVSTSPVSSLVTITARP